MSRRKFLCALAGAVSLAFAGCGNSEEQQAKAFADFLDHRILEKPGLHVPDLSEEERASFGRFAQDYGIVRGFQDDLDASVKDYALRLHPVPPNASLGDLAKYKPDLMAVREWMVKIEGALDGALARAQAARAALKQPDILKSRFDQVFERTVVTPHKVMHEIIPPSRDLLDAEIAIADFMIAHKADIATVGTQLQVSKPEVRNELQRLLAAYNAKAPQLAEANRKFEALGHGP